VEGEINDRGKRIGENDLEKLVTPGFKGGKFRDEHKARNSYWAPI